MLLVDNNEPPEFDSLLGQMGIPVQRGNFNQSPGQSSSTQYPDFTVLSENKKIIGVNRKQATEALGDLDAVESQLHSELQGPIDGLTLMVEGLVCWHPDGMAGFSVEPEKVTHERGRGGHEYDKLVCVGRVFHQSYARWSAFVERLWDVGIPVVSTGDIRGSAVFLSRLHNGEPNTIFTRLIKTNYILSDYDLDRAKRAKSYMGLSDGKIGQELGLVYADTGLKPGQMGIFLHEGGTVSELKLPSGRRVGTAAQLNLMHALGIKSGVPGKTEYSKQLEGEKE